MRNSVAVLLAAVPLCAAEAAPINLANQVQTVTITSTQGQCDTEVNYTYNVYYRPDGTYQTRELKGTLVDSGTYRCTASTKPDEVLLDYESYPVLGATALVRWHEVMHFDTPTRGTIDGSEYGSIRCDYAAKFDMKPAS